jgi:hypothetical protein
MPRGNDAPDPYDSEKTRQLLNMVQRWMHDMDRQCEAYLDHNATQAHYALPFLGALPVQPTSFETMRILLLEEFQNQIMRGIKDFTPVIHDRHPRRRPEPPADKRKDADPNAEEEQRNRSGRGDRGGRSDREDEEQSGDREPGQREKRIFHKEDKIVADLQREYSKDTTQILESKLKQSLKVLQRTEEDILEAETLVRRNVDKEHNLHRLDQLDESRHLTQLRIKVIRSILHERQLAEPGDDDASHIEELESAMVTAERLEHAVPPGSQASKLTIEIEQLLTSADDLLNQHATTLAMQRISQASEQASRISVELSESYSSVYSSFSDDAQELADDLSAELQAALMTYGEFEDLVMHARAQDLWKTSPRLYKAWLHAQRA